MLWHRGLGHFYQANINKYLNIHNFKLVNCLDCKIFKLNRKPHNKETPKASRILEVNITPRKGNGNKITNESFYHRKVDLKYIKVFGCVAYYKNFC